MEKKSVKSSSEQSEYLQSKGVSELDSQEIVSQFWRHHPFASLLSDDFYLDQVATYAVDKVGTEFRIAKFYQYFTESVIGEPGLNKAAAKLAFCLELMQDSAVNIELAEAIISTTATSLLIDKQLLKNVDGSISFRHPSLHSFYSACFLDNTREPVQFLSETLYSEKTTILLPANWYEVIAYLIQLEHGGDVAGWLVAQIHTHKSILDEGLLDALSQSHIEEHLSVQERHSLFKLIFKLYLDRNVWLPSGAEAVLAAIVQTSDIELLRATMNAEYNTDTDSLIARSNAIAVVDEILKLNPDAINPDREYWHEVMIESANDQNENGVLQRRALNALIQFKSPRDISRLKGAKNHKDKLVHEAFLKLCYEISPNARQTILYLAQGMLRGSEIYSRYGLYEINSAIGVNNFLKVFSSKTTFVQKFLDMESIFNSHGRREDEKLLELIRHFMSPTILVSAKRFVDVAYHADFGYYAERSYFIPSLVDIILSNDGNYALEVTEGIKDAGDQTRLAHLLGRVVSVENYKEIYSILCKKFDKSVADDLMYLMRFEGNNDVYQAAVEANLVEAVAVKIDSKSTQEEKIYKDFIFALEPEEGKYNPQVFGMYFKNKDLLSPKLTPKQRQRLLYLAKEDILDRYDPKEIKVKITSTDPKSQSHNFNITSYASYYDDVLRVAIELIGEKEVATNYRSQMIHYLPFAYDDERTLILDLVGSFTDEEFVYLNSVYLDKKQDTRYYLPSVYIDILKHSKLRGFIPDSVKEVLRSFIDDKKLSIYERESSIEMLGDIISANDTTESSYLRLIFRRNIRPDGILSLAETANKILINTFKDTVAIRWRFNEIGKRVSPHTETREFHWVSPLEHELRSKEFAKPLLHLGGNYQSDFIKLLDISIEVLNLDRTKYIDYSYYIWSISYEYFSNLAKLKSDKPLVRLEKWFRRKAKKVEGANWFEGNLENLRKIYAQELSKVSVHDAVERAEGLIHGS